MESMGNLLVNGWRGGVEQGLLELAQSSAVQSPRLSEALEYVLTGGGKRLRALFALAVCNDLADLENEATNRALSSAIAIEALHAASLVHDDLPALDNDDMRRGKPSCHRAFPESTAILVGDALFGAALHTVLADDVLPTDVRARIARVLARVWRDLCVGQQMDLSLAASEAEIDRAEMIRLKTGIMFGAAAASGALCAGAHDQRVDEYFAWGIRVGECFQALDDLSDGDRPESDRPTVERECREVFESLKGSLGLLEQGATATIVRAILSI